VEAVGLFGLSLVVIVPVIRFCNLGLRHAQATDVGHEFQFSHYFTLRSLTNGLALLLIVTIVQFFDLGAEGGLVVLLIALSRIIEAQSDVYHGMFQYRERMDYIARARIVRGPLALALFALGILVTGDLSVGCLGLIAAALVMLLFHDMRLARRFLAPAHAAGAQGVAPVAGPISIAPFAWDVARLTDLVRQVLPLGCAAMLLALQTSIPRYAIEYELGLEALGYFTAVVVAYSAITRMMNTLAHSASPRMARRYKLGDRRGLLLLLAKLGGFGCLFGGAGVLVTAAFGREILTLLYAPAYGDYADILVLVMVAAFLRLLANLWQLSIVAARRFWVQFLLHLVNVVILVISSLLLVPPYGLHGAVIVIILAAATHLIGVVGITAMLIRGLHAHDDPVAKREA
jgi:O-antigen/teichoic acid export membrane protein